ncbi:hypothetical protein GTP55_24690 [Duganella sp. FT109W]|uniref:Uncharacterized protein n=1 Tax=Duganella margarita TaxID=2692170 RepID=A0A7X4GWN0_9BURK|nr:hypothetical protein [Duganella margarita]MYM71082.1 hypothetical protein [Duganella margarita]MYN42542.1 hypothetical protein [Duganella margarita]
MLTRVTDTIIEELIDATCNDTRSRHFFLHALHGLVRVAKAEQLQELQRDVKLSTGEISQPEGCDSDSREPT